MTKRFIIILIAISTLSITSAQEFDFFALGGPVFSQIDGDHFGGYNKIGALVGLGVSHPINEEWNAQMELEYIQKGKGTYNEADGSSYKIKLNYLQLPIAINYRILEKLSVETGLAVSLLLSSKFYENGEPNDDHSLYTPNKFDINWLLGSTYALSKEWKINLRFSYSIFPMGNTLEGVEDVYSPNVWRKPGGQYNNSLALAMQYWF